MIALDSRNMILYFISRSFTLTLALFQVGIRRFCDMISLCANREEEEKKKPTTTEFNGGVFHLVVVVSFFSTQRSNQIVAFINRTVICWMQLFRPLFDAAAAAAALPLCQRSMFQLLYTNRHVQVKSIALTPPSYMFHSALFVCLSFCFYFVIRLVFFIFFLFGSIKWQYISYVQSYIISWIRYLISNGTGDLFVLYKLCLRFVCFCLDL